MSSEKAIKKQSKKTVKYRKALAKSAKYVEKHHSNKLCKKGSFTKGLPHNNDGIVSDNAFDSLLTAIKYNTEEKWNSVILGPSIDGYNKALLVNPLATLFKTPIGFNSQAIAPPNCPAYNSNETATDMVELYLMASNRKISFTELNNIDTSALKALAKYNPDVLPFRGNSAGDQIGPYISQLLLLDLPLIATSINQKYNELNDIEYLTDINEWLKAQNGNVKTTQSFSTNKKYIYNGRQLANFVHSDPPCQAWINAANILFKMNFPLSQTNPYLKLNKCDNSPCDMQKWEDFCRSTKCKMILPITNQVGFATFGIADIHAMLAEVSQLSLVISWSSKFLIDLRLRPEELGGLVYFGCKELPALLTQSTAIPPGKLLSQVYPEGAPLHPSYPSGHACVGGACATVLKAFFDGKAQFNSPVEASTNGDVLEPIPGTLILTNELDKMASNMSYGRNWAGIHYRSDAEEGILLGERIAIEYLKQRKCAYGENFAGFQLTTRNGKNITI